MKEIVIFVLYIGMLTLVGGHAWHTTCSDVGPPRWICSALLGATWPVYLLSKGGIAIMDPANEWPTLQFEKRK